MRGTRGVRAECVELWGGRVLSELSGGGKWDGGVRERAVRVSEHNGIVRGVSVLRSMWVTGHMREQDVCAAASMQRDSGELRSGRSVSELHSTE